MYAIYARQSIEKKDSVSIEAQIEKCKYFCDGQDYKIYKDSGYSGKNINRPQFSKLLEDIKSGVIKKVIAYRLDRISRSIADFSQLLIMFDEYNVDFISATENFDTNTPMGRAMINIVMTFAQLERETIVERVTDNYYFRANNGYWAGGYAPYGYNKYKLPKQKGYSLKINESEANMIKFIFDMYCNGDGLEFICNELTKRGYKPRRSNEFSTSTISHILTNPVYIGKIKYTDKATVKKVMNGNIVRVKNENRNVIYVDGLHDPIIGIEQWNKVQNIRNNNLINRTKVDYTLKNPMASILKCGICGRSLSRITYSDRNDIRICCRKCKENVGSNIDYVEDKLLQSLKLLLEDYKIKLLNNDNSDIEMLLKVNEDNILNSRNELDKLKLQLNKTYDLLEQEVYTKDIFVERSNLLKQQIKETNDNINKLETEKKKIIATKDNKEILIPKIENVIDSYYETDNIRLKNELLKSILEKVEYTKIAPKDKDDFKLKLFLKIQA